jgi:L-ascorbate metabolism protein UlaG (beta-lactamase superfamily)
MQDTREDCVREPMKIQRLSVSSFKLFTGEGKVVMIDPWLTNDPLWPKSEKTADKFREIDVLAVTHAHFDHAAGVEEIAALNDRMSIVAQWEFGLSLMQKGLKNVIPTSYGATFEIAGLRISSVMAAHTSSIIDDGGRIHSMGSAMGYVIEVEDGTRVYFSGDTGLTADMKFVVGDFFHPDISFLSAIGNACMEPEQAAYAANATGCRIAVPFHDFPRTVEEAADPEGYGAFVKADPFHVLDTHKKIDRFMETLAQKYPHIKGVYLPIGETAEF